jgi:type IV pilus assembly protein PilC
MSARDTLYTDLGSLLRFKGKPWRGPRFLDKSRRYRQLRAVLGQVQLIFSANAPLAGGIEAAAVDARPGITRNVLMELRRRIESGDALSEAMAGMDRFFPAWTVGLVRAGEEIGQPDETLGLVLAEIQERTESHAETVNVMMYLFTLGAGCIQAIAMSYLIFVSVMNDVLADFSEYAPQYEPGALTRMLLRLANLPEKYLPGGPLGIAMVFVILVMSLPAVVILLKALFTRAMRLPRLGELWDRMPIRVPLAGTLLRDTALASATHVLAVQLESGLPTDEAVEQAGASVSETSVGRAFRKAADGIRAGQSMGEAFGGAGKAIPAGFRVALSLGERAGRPSEVLRHYSHRFRAHAGACRRALLDLLLPAGVLCAGAAVLFVSQGVFRMLIALVDAMADAT